jgi:hypothetical protein
MESSQKRKTKMTTEELCKIESHLKRAKEKHEEILKKLDVTSMEFFRLYIQQAQIQNCLNCLDDVRFALNIIERFKSSLPEIIKEKNNIS